MKFKIQLVTQTETGENIQELACLERETEGLEEIGINLTEAKALLAGLQKQVVEQQIAAYLADRNQCPHCALAFRHKDQHPVVFRTLFGNLEFPSPRWFRCNCQSHETRTFSPLAELLTEHCSPERLYLETKWASLVSFDLAAQLFEELLPSKPIFTPPVSAIIYSALRNGPRPDLAKSRFSLSTGARRSGPRYQGRRHPSPSGSMAVT